MSVTRCYKEIIQPEGVRYPAHLCTYEVFQRTLRSPAANSLHSSENTYLCLNQSTENKAFPQSFVSQDSNYLQPAYLNE